MRPPIPWIKWVMLYGSLSHVTVIVNEWREHKWYAVFAYSLTSLAWLWMFFGQIRLERADREWRSGMAELSKMIVDHYVMPLSDVGQHHE